MLVVDASCVYEVLIGTPRSQIIRERMSIDSDHAAPHVVDVEVLNVIRREHLRGRLDATAARQAVDDLRDWRVERYSHGGLLDRAWELRDNVRGWDAFYVALAEALGAILLTIDGRLGRSAGPRCHIEVVPLGQ
jgi:predicted nucleic acid-binding protein